MSSEAQALAAAVHKLSREGGGGIWVHSAVWQGEHVESPECPCQPALVIVDPLN